MPRPESRPAMALRSFWKPHLAPAPPNVILSCESLFFRDGCGNFYRPVPAHFQVLLRVDMVDFDEEIVIPSTSRIA